LTTYVTIDKNIIDVKSDTGDDDINYDETDSEDDDIHDADDDEEQEVEEINN